MASGARAVSWSGWVPDRCGLRIPMPGNLAPSFRSHTSQLRSCHLLSCLHHGKLSTISIARKHPDLVPVAVRSTRVQYTTVRCCGRAFVETHLEVRYRTRYTSTVPGAAEHGRCLPRLCNRTCMATSPCVAVPSGIALRHSH